MKKSYDRYEILCQTVGGHVLHCPDCSSLQVRFGNAVIGLTPDDFAAFRQVVGVEHETLFYIGDSGVGFAFSAEEIVRLNELLDQAELMLSLRERHWGATSSRAPVRAAFVPRGGASIARH